MRRNGAGFLREGLRSRQRCPAVSDPILRRFARSVDVIATERCRAGSLSPAVRCRHADDDAAREHDADGARHGRLSAARPHRPRHGRGARPDGRGRRTLDALPASRLSADDGRTPHPAAGGGLAETAARLGLSVDGGLLVDSEAAASPGARRRSTRRHAQRASRGPATDAVARHAASAAVTWRCMIVVCTCSRVLSVYSSRDACGRLSAENVDYQRLNNVNGICYEFCFSLNLFIFLKQLLTYPRIPTIQIQLI